MGLFKRQLFVTVLILLGFVVSCAKKPPLPYGSDELLDKNRPYNIEVGVASWYGKQFHGRKTSSGEMYNMNDMTAAHKYAPFGASVLVINLENGKRTKVRVNDRGPFVAGRIIDLSYAAAKELGVTETGTAKVEVRFLNTAVSYKKKYYVQLGSFENKPYAITFKNKMMRHYQRVIIKKSPNTFRVLAGPFYTRDKADELKAQFTKRNIPGFVVSEPLS